MPMQRYCLVTRLHSVKCGEGHHRILANHYSKANRFAVDSDIKPARSGFKLRLKNTADGSRVVSPNDRMAGRL
jgi:hypothetical protein